LESLKTSIDLYHAIVLRGTIEDIERILEFIQSETDSKLIYRHHSGRYLKVIEGDVEGGRRYG